MKGRTIVVIEDEWDARLRETQADIRRRFRNLEHLLDRGLRLRDILGQETRQAERRGEA